MPALVCPLSGAPVETNATYEPEGRSIVSVPVEHGSTNSVLWLLGLDSATVGHTPPGLSWISNTIAGNSGVTVIETTLDCDSENRYQSVSREAPPVSGFTKVRIDPKMVSPQR